jgi:hypothetical protein
MLSDVILNVIMLNVEAPSSKNDHVFKCYIAYCGVKCISGNKLPFLSLT